MLLAGYIDPIPLGAWRQVYNPSMPSLVIPPAAVLAAALKDFLETTSYDELPPGTPMEGSIPLVDPHPDEDPDERL